MDAIVLDGNERSALAATRSLGKKGIRVIVGAETLPSLSSSSKYCSKAFSYPSPSRNADKFLYTLMDYLSNKSNSVLLPMTDITLYEVLKKRKEFGNSVKIPFVDYDRYVSASDKVNIFTIARDLDIPMPKTLLPSDFDDRKSLMEKIDKFGFPVVVKPSRSRIRVGNGWVDTTVRYSEDQHELNTILNDDVFRRHPFVVQEKIEGHGIGIFLLMKDGDVLALFAHRRIREKPPSGGVSVLCESIKPPPVASAAAIKLLRHLSWSGVAMVEFKADILDDTPKLMEVNARFWGSLQLAISAGIDFPYLLYCMSTGTKLEIPTSYKIGLKSRWELGDLDHLLIRLKGTSSQLHLPANAPPVRHVMKNFILDTVRPRVRNEIFRIDDPKPFVFELKQYLRNIVNACAA